MNTKFIGISPDIREDTTVSLVMGGAFIALGMWNSLFILSTPQTGYFSATVAAMEIEWQALLVVVIAPIVETALILCCAFGVISSLLDRYVVHHPGIRVAITILATSLIFAALHIFAYGTALEAAYIGAFSFNVVGAILMLWRNSQIIPTIAHCVINACVYWGIFVII